MKKFYIVLVGLLIGLGTSFDADAQETQTWYTLASGDWDDPKIWTLDPACLLYTSDAADE